MVDKLLNGTILGTLMGVLIASSSIGWLQSIVSNIVAIVPADYQFQYIRYVLMGVLGAIAGYIIDKR